MKKKYIVTLMIIITGIMIYNMKNSRGEILKIEPNPEKGFSYEYYLYIPKGAAQSEIKYMLVEPNNGGRASDNHKDHVLDAKRLLLSKWCNKMAKALKTPLLVPVFDRPKSNWKMYTHDLDRDTLKNNEGKLSRIDLQLINMIKDAQEKLRDKGIVLEDKVFMHGFSASGSFVNRFAALHPRYVKAVASGGISYMPILPRDVWEEEKLIYPIGVYDIEEIADIQFNLSQYRDVAQYIYMGYMDDNDPLPYDDSYDEEERDVIKRFLGIPLMGRWEKSKEIYEALNIPAQFVVYNGVEHEIKDEMLEDIIHFYQANNNEGIHYIQSYQYPFMEKHQLEKVHIKDGYNP
ncbi:hypothetical protein HZI73_18480 [Vallitalea pronyensis]|uniref:Uncharacterized protein n=1 Tax=Vallitalea pronyensis TaxID=1348613 RepID=A0A8J8MMD2_9FIRM|nr:hypothetical protein [Vallitalea pronyensis]QUI24156.1 hypothetical protein HZI73_18480 [Vallitalea pronyensis]